MRKERVSERDIAWALHKMPIPTAFFIWLSSRIKFSSLCFACLLAFLCKQLDAYRVVEFFISFFYHPLFRMERYVRTYARRKGYSEIEYNDDDGYDNDDDAMAPKRYYRHSSFRNRCVHTHKIHTRPEHRIKIAKSSPRKHSTINIRPLFVKPIHPPTHSLTCLMLRKGQKIYFSVEMPCFYEEPTCTAACTQLWNI